MKPNLTKNEMAYFANCALGEFRRESESTHEDSLGDLLMCMMFWADQRSFDFDLALERAMGQYQEEKGKDFNILIVSGPVVGALAASLTVKAVSFQATHIDGNEYQIDFNPHHRIKVQAILQHYNPAFWKWL